MLLSAPLGNGTLNKQAGVDFKQLSLLAKINENQSGEVGQVNFIRTAFNQSYSLKGLHRRHPTEPYSLI